MIAAMQLREVIEFPINISVTANATQIVAGSSATAVGPTPSRPMRLIRLQCSGHCSAAANTPELNIGVFKNLIPAGLPTPNLTNRAMVAKQLAVASTGHRFYSAEPLDAGMDAFDGVGDFWTMGAWCTGATGTCGFSTFHIRLEFLIL